VSGSDTGTIVRARATLRTTFRPRLELRFPRLLVDLLFLAAKVSADYADRADFGKAKFLISWEAQAAGLFISAVVQMDCPSRE
jgi:hypothetical protein